MKTTRFKNNSGTSARVLRYLNGLVEREFHFLQRGNNLRAFGLRWHHSNKNLNDNSFVFLQAELQNCQKFGDDFVKYSIAAFCIDVSVALVDTCHTPSWLETQQVATTNQRTCASKKGYRHKKSAANSKRKLPAPADSVSPALTTAAKGSSPFEKMPMPIKIKSKKRPSKSEDVTSAMMTLRAERPSSSLRKNL